MLVNLDGRDAERWYCPALDISMDTDQTETKRLVRTHSNIVGHWFQGSRYKNKLATRTRGQARPFIVTYAASKGCTTTGRNNGTLSLVMGAAWSLFFGATSLGIRNMKVLVIAIRHDRDIIIGPARCTNAACHACSRKTAASTIHQMLNRPSLLNRGQGIVRHDRFDTSSSLSFLINRHRIPTSSWMVDFVAHIHHRWDVTRCGRHGAISEETPKSKSFEK